MREVFSSLSNKLTTRWEYDALGRMVVRRDAAGEEERLVYDGSRAVVLTYGGVYLYRRPPGQGWTAALQQTPEIVSRSRNRQAESVAFDATGESVLITIEQRNAPLFRLPLTQPATED